MTRPQTLAARLRWWLLAAGVLCLLAGLFWIFNVLWPKWGVFPGDPKTGVGLLGVLGFWCEEESYGFWASGYLGIFLVTQWFFLGPRGRWRVRLSAAGRPLKPSVLTAALMAVLLTVGLLATVAQVAGGWQKIALVTPLNQPEIPITRVTTGLAVATTSTSAPATTAAGTTIYYECGRVNEDPRPRIWPLASALAASWALWTVIFLVYWRRGNRADQLGGMLRGLMGGSILELLIATPVHVLAARPEDKCYCERGSYTGLVLGGTVLLWTFGPGLVLLFLREKERRSLLLSPPTDQA